MSARDLLRRYRKDPRLIAAIPVVIIVVTTFVYYLIQRANELSPEALGNRLLLFVLWNINLVLVIGVLFVLLRVVIKLLLERKKGILGSRFRTKLVVTYLVTTFVPIALLFLIATDLLRVSIDRWPWPVDGVAYASHGSARSTASSWTGRSGPPPRVDD